MATAAPNKPEPEMTTLLDMTRLDRVSFVGAPFETGCFYMQMSSLWFLLIQHSTLDLRVLTSTQVVFRWNYWKLVSCFVKHLWRDQRTLLPYACVISISMGGDFAIADRSVIGETKENFTRQHRWCRTVVLGDISEWTERKGKETIK